MFKRWRMVANDAVKEERNEKKCAREEGQRERESEREMTGWKETKGSLLKGYIFAQ
jgi:hypothetical protein